MVHPYYREKILPFLEQHKVVNKLVKTPFVGTGFELKELAKTLRVDEELRYITACKSGEARVLVCVTNLRLHILDKGLVLNKYQLTVNLPQIASVQRGRGVFFGSVVISVLGYEDNIYLTDFWGKDTEDFQRALQDAITDYGLGRSQLTQPNHYPSQPPYYPQEPYYQQQTERRFQQPMYESNNPTYNYLTGEPFTESELLERGLDRNGIPLNLVSSSTTRSNVRSVQQQYAPQQSTVTLNKVPKPPKDVSNLSTGDKFDALDSGGFGTEEQLRQAKLNLEEAYRSGLISESLYNIKMQKYKRGLL